MKQYILLGLVVPALALGACGQQKTAEEQVKEQVATSYALTADERSLASANAKKYFEQSWPVNIGEPKNGKLINCRPTDSNKNGLVSCNGYAVNLKGELFEKTVYAGYTPSVVGVSDQDTVNAK